MTDIARSFGLTPPEQWLAGLLWADGYLGRNVWIRTGGKLIRGSTVYLNLADEELIEEAAWILGPAARRHLTQPPKDEGCQPLYRLAFSDYGSKLAALGFGPKPQRTWPSELASGSFLRGLFDGDGCVIWHVDRRYSQRRYLRTILDGPVAVLEGLRDWLAERGISSRKMIYRGGDCWELRWGHDASLRLAEVMYAEPGPFLERKRVVFQGHQ